MAGLIGPEERRDYTVMGDTVNVAARLMSAAPAGTVLVGSETRHATARAVLYLDSRSLTMKGKAQPVSVFQAVDLLHSTHVARPLGTAPLVGRDEELALMSRLWSKVVREARPHLLSIIGDPGIGKSRIVAEFEQNALSEAEAVVLHGRCLP